MRGFLGGRKLALAVAALAGACSALGQGTVNGAGATLFVDFFRLPGSTTDFLDVDGDGDLLIGPGLRDQLANNQVASWTAPFGPDDVSETWWLVQYRSVGSIEGFTEWVEYQTCGDLPESIPSERGIINRRDFALTGVVVAVPGAGPACTDDTDSDAIPNASGTPICVDAIDFANTDVPTTWAIRGPAGAPNWDATPTSAGYGQNPETSNGAPAQAGQSNALSSLTGSCSTSIIGQTFDTAIAFSPVAPIANRGAGLETVNYTDLQHSLVTGRFPSGENFAQAVRDVGSGTRNAFANPLGVDPSHCVGDHVGVRQNVDSLMRLGPRHQVSNCGGSSIMEAAVRNRRNSVGFTGLVGGSRAIGDALAGSYEILNVVKDIDSDGDTLIDGTLPVRPARASVIQNGDPDTGYQIGALQTLVTVGNPNANRDPNDPLFQAGTPVANQNAADLINNITSSIAEFEEPNNPAADLELTPGQTLANNFFLVGGVDAIPVDNNPKEFVPNPFFLSATQTYVLSRPFTDTPAWGSVNPAGLTPQRRIPDFDGSGALDPNEVYSDGSLNGNYRYNNGSGITVFPNQNARLSASNDLMGDFNQDNVRDCSDIAQMMVAFDDPANFDSTSNGGATGDMSIDVMIPEIIGDFNGDGNFDGEDFRYMADGHAMVGGALDRGCGFTAVDNASQAVFGDGNFFDTVLATGRPYVAGASRGDVAGASPRAALGVTPGAAPTGFDGSVDAVDLDYICVNLGNWTDLDQAQNMDLSADMDGDLDVDLDDLLLILGGAALQTAVGDVDLDCDVDLDDLLVVLGNFGQPGGWADGNLTCASTVNLDSLLLVLGNFDFACP